MTMTYTGAVLDAPDARELAAFYRRLLGWTTEEDSEQWVVLCDPAGTARLSFQTEPGYRRPVWPGRPGEQLMMAHLDIEVDDLAAEVARAVEAGAEVADFQPQEQVRVCFDPAGHPFCLYVREN
ncbi:VOC family protein [Actinophytocola glycyrrhizae]|uniref:VOC family protein n=1 Tax=Actinophytocola glycyrrhizae TaxID=2044873 RepID=A0ABV9S215_9PSEU